MKELKFRLAALETGGFKITEMRDVATIISRKFFIKKEDAPEVFNALKKIKEDKAWEEINRLMRNRQVKEED